MWPVLMSQPHREEEKDAILPNKMPTEATRMTHGIFGYLNARPSSTKIVHHHTMTAMKLVWYRCSNMFRIFSLNDSDAVKS